MKKGKAVGISVAVIAVVIVFGIASLPDEVLLDAPIGASENTPTETFPTEFQPEKVSTEKQPVALESEAEPETPEAEPETPEAEPETPEAEPETPEAEPETPEAEPETPEESEGNVIEVKISDGVGSGDR